MLDTWSQFDELSGKIEFKQSHCVTQYDLTFSIICSAHFKTTTGVACVAKTYTVLMTCRGSMHVYKQYRTLHRAAPLHPHRCPKYSICAPHMTVHCRKQSQPNLFTRRVRRITVSRGVCLASICTTTVSRWIYWTVWSKGSHRRCSYTLFKSIYCVAIVSCTSFICNKFWIYIFYSVYSVVVIQPITVMIC